MSWVTLRNLRRFLTLLSIFASEDEDCTCLGQMQLSGQVEHNYNNKYVLNVHVHVKVISVEAYVAR